MHPVLRTLLASLVILAAGVAALAAMTHGFRVYTTEGALRLAVSAHPRPIPSVVFERADGTLIDTDRWRGQWLLVDFIYTRCTTYCSAQGSQYARLQERLPLLLESGRLRLVSISFDPAHDSAAELAAFQRRSGDRGLGWSAVRTTRPEDLDTLLRTFGVTVIDDGLGGYEHTVALAVVDPKGRLVRIIDGDAIAEAERYIRARVQS